MHCTLHVELTDDTPAELVLQRVRALFFLDAIDEVVIDTRVGPGVACFVELKDHFGPLVRQRRQVSGGSA